MWSQESKSIGNRVAIIGRPNVGKSTLFNVLTRSRKAVVKNEPGVTRDAQIELTEWWGSSFEVMDTGGITDEKEGFSPLIRELVLSVLETATMVIVVMDGRAGLVPEDRDIIRVAKESGKPFLIVVNKIDSLLNYELETAEFFEFGMDVIPASFEKRDNIDCIVEWIRSRMSEAEKDPREGVRLSLVGKPNVGKSSLANRLLGQKRMLVSEIAGTTVDAIEEQIEYRGQKYILVDTAGLRRSARRQDGIEYLSAVKSHDSIHRSDIVLLLVDGTLGPTDQDTKVLEYALERHKPVILVANKSDLGQNEIPEYRKKFREQVARQFHFFQDIPIEFVSAKTGAGLDHLFEKIEDIWKKVNTVIPTSKLNKFFFSVIRQLPAPVWGSQNVKIYYLVRTRQVPPSFIAFANYPQGVTRPYRRFLAKRIQQEWELEGIPIRIFVMQSRRSKTRQNREDRRQPEYEIDESVATAEAENWLAEAEAKVETWGEPVFQYALDEGSANERSLEV
ncbi:MAG: ribosome biogenesis GTPase Der [Bdellovibrionales bacterium]|nr:ribosome biogenesis GTPase Der [Bdellovibrionales bacterium]